MKKSTSIWQEDLLTIRDYLRYAQTRFTASERFYGHGTDNCWDEALYLILGLLHLPADCDERILDARLTATEREQIYEAINARAEQAIPSAYLTNKSWFAGLEFYVDERTLIPRSPIAELIEHQFKPFMPCPEDVNDILELGTGNANLAILAAHYFPHANIIASDINDEALEVAAKNIAKHHCEQEITLLNSDLFSHITGHFDIIFTNPPYVSEEEYAQLPQEYFHEPKASLVAEDEGLALVIQILQLAHQYLNDDGILVVEVGNSDVTLCQRYPQVPFTWLEFERGGSGVLLLTKSQLLAYF